MELFYHDIPQTDAEEWASKLKAFSLAAFHGSLTYAGYKAIPSAYLICDNDKAISLERQLAMVKGCGVEIKVKHSASGHSPMLSKPHDVIDLIKSMVE